MGRSVRKGEKAFYVWAPVKRRLRQEEAELWKAQGRTVKYDPDGRPAVQVVAFTLSPTFDLSQTDGEPFEIPTVQQARRVKTAGGVMAQLLQGDDPTGAYDDVVKLIKDAGYAFDLAAPGAPYLGSANGVTVTGPGIRQVLVRDDVSAAQRTKTTLHELAHIRCEHTTGVRLGENLHRGRKETEAESVAHLVCRALGLDSQAYTDFSGVMAKRCHECAAHRLSLVSLSLQHLSCKQIRMACRRMSEADVKHLYAAQVSSTRARTIVNRQRHLRWPCGVGMPGAAGWTRRLTSWCASLSGFWLARRA